MFSEDVTTSTVLRKKRTESDALSAGSNIDTKGDDDPSTPEDESNPVGGLIVSNIPTPTNTTASIVLQGGVANKDYTLVCEITTSTSAKTSAAIVTKRLINLRVRERN